PSVTQLADRVVSEQPILPVSPGALARARRARKSRARAVLGAYVALTKPRIIELLLVTTVPSMLLAARGVPSLWLVAVVLACGAAPVLIGWAAVTGGLAWPAWLLFAVVFLWQPPHFYALAIKFKDDYARAGIPMLPVVASMRRVGFETVLYAWLTVLVSLAL